MGEGRVPAEDRSRRALRICYLLDDLGSGGAQRQAVETAGALHSRGAIAARFLTYHPDPFFLPRLRELGIPHERVAKRVGFDWGFHRRLRRALRGEGEQQAPDVVHAFMRGPSFWAARALPGRSAGGRPGLITSERNAYVPGAAGRGQRWRERVALRTAFRRADLVTANAETVAREIPKRFGVDAAKVHYVPNGIDLSAWDRLQQEDCPLTLGPKSLHVGVVGRLVAQKNHLLFLHALAEASRAKNAPRWHAWLLGARGRNQSTAPAVEAAIDSLGLREHVTLLDAQPAIASILKRLDLVVLSSDFEGFPNVALEAMAARTPVIATAVGDIPNLMDRRPDGQATGGLVVPSGDTEALAAALEAVADMPPAERSALGQSGRERVEAHYEMERIAARYLELYERAAGA